jgi:3-oxoacyl-[acyl-carrier protein] reductase
MAYTDISGKCFVVTGAGSGMGRATALQLASLGANVGLLDIRKPDHVEKEIEEENKGNSIAVKCDVTDAQQVNSAVDEVTQKFGRLDGAANMAGWVGNQGIHGKAYGFDVITDADWDNVVKVNLDGVKNCIRAELQHMKGPGSIVSAASIAGQFGPPWSGPYSVAKWGVISTTK